MSLIEHIRELRSRLLKALLGLAVGMTIGWIFFNPGLEVPRESRTATSRWTARASAPGTSAAHLVVNGVFDAFFLHLKITFLVALIISSPVWLYQLWAFIAPGLYAREKRWTFSFVGTAVPLFVLGGLFAYLAMGKAMGFFSA